MPAALHARRLLAPPPAPRNSACREPEAKSRRFPATPCPWPDCAPRFRHRLLPGIKNTPETYHLAKESDLRWCARNRNRERAEGALPESAQYQPARRQQAEKFERGGVCA